MADNLYSAYDKTGRDGLTSEQRNYAQTLSGPQREAFEQMPSGDRAAMMSEATKPLGDKQKPPVKKEEPLRVGKGLAQRNGQISLKNPKGNGDGSASSTSTPGGFGPQTIHLCVNSLPFTMVVLGQAPVPE